jgi:hypothetical protein
MRDTYMPEQNTHLSAIAVIRWSTQQDKLRRQTVRCPVQVMLPSNVVDQTD